MGKEDGKWVTIKGTHVFIPEGKRVSEVLKSKFKLQGTSTEKYNSNINKTERSYNARAKANKKLYKDSRARTRADNENVHDYRVRENDIQEKYKEGLVGYETKGLQNAMPQRTAPKGELSGMEATNALDKLEKGMPVMVKYGKDFEPKQTIYLGRSDEGRFAFYDGGGVTGRFDFGEQWLKDNPNVSFNFEDNDPVEWNRLSQELLGNKDNKPNWDKDTYGIKTLSKEESNNYVEDWSNGKNVEDGKFISKQDGKYVAIDNSTGECWVEEFDNEKDAIDYLNGTDPEEIRDRAQKNSKENPNYKSVNKAKESAEKYMAENYEKKKQEMNNWLEKTKGIKGKDDTFEKAKPNVTKAEAKQAMNYIKNSGYDLNAKAMKEYAKYESAEARKYRRELDKMIQRTTNGEMTFNDFREGEKALHSKYPKGASEVNSNNLQMRYYNKFGGNYDDTKEDSLQNKANQVVKGLTEDKLDSGVKVKGDKNVIPRNFTKGYGKFKVKTTGSNNLNDNYEITKDEYGTYHAKNLRTGETLTTFVDHLRNNNVFEFTNKTKDNYKKWSAKKPSKKSSSKYEEFLKRNK